jgi:phenylacetate-CoA ligase
VTGALKPFALPQFTLHQAADGSLRMEVRRTAIDVTQIRNALLTLFGSDQVLTMEEVDSLEGTRDKVSQYTSDMP